MAKEYLFLDLDNTIYPVASIGDKLFKELFDLIKSSGEYSGNFEDIRREVMRRPFQHIARDFSFSDTLFEGSMQLMNNLTYNQPMQPFEDYKYLKEINIPKILVTVGFTKLQQSKVKQLGIENDFESVIIIDPGKTDMSKKDMFARIMNDKKLRPEDILIIGDDINSEIKAGQELGIDTVLYDRIGNYPDKTQENYIQSFSELKSILTQTLR